MDYAQKHAVVRCSPDVAKKLRIGVERQPAGTVLRGAALERHQPREGSRHDPHM